MFGLKQSRYFGQAINPDLFPHRFGPDTRMRGLEAADAAQYTQHLLRLSERDRHARFHASLSDNALREHTARIDWDQVFIFGIFVGNNLRATGELIPLSDPERGEVSLSVESEFQHSGFGKMLILAVFLAARRLEMTHLHIFFRHGNEGMQSLSRDIGAKTRFADGALEAIVAVPPRPDTTTNPAPA